MELMAAADTGDILFTASALQPEQQFAFGAPEILVVLFVFLAL